jgi:MFS family permease
MYSGSFLLGNIAGPALGGSVTGLGLRTPFYIYAGTLLVAGSIGLALLPRMEPIDPARPRDETPVMPLREALASRPYRAALYTNMADHWAAMGIRLTLIPLFVVEGLHLGDEWAFRGLFVVAISNAAVLYPAARWADDRGRRRGVGAVHDLRPGNA